MIVWRSGVVRDLGRAWSGSQELTVEIDDGAPAADPREDASREQPPVPPGTVVRALVYPGLVGQPQVGDRVCLTVSALARGLGTGGYALVAAIPDRLPPDPPPGPGHIVKARYTPLQTMVLGVDEQESSWHEALREADDLAGLPVVVADLHSAVPAVLAGIRDRAHHLGRPAPRVAYVMTDGGALPAWFSRMAAGLRASGWLAATITVNQAFGGDLEAVTVHSGLLAARLVLGAEVVVVAQGPGNLGTGTRWGFSGVAAGDALNAVGALGGRGVAALRVSGADPRERHFGISHHSLTAYGRVALVPCDVVVPLLPQELCDVGERVRQQVEDIVEPRGRHRAVEVDTAGLLDALSVVPVGLSTMGRGLNEDPAAFLASAAAGVHAVDLLTG